MAKVFEKVVVEYPPEDLCAYPEYIGKPYFSIMYEENGEHFIGFGTYKPEVFSQYLSEYFISQPTCEDWMDVPSDEMTIEQARQAVKDLRKKLADTINTPCEDAISRQAVLDATAKKNSAWNAITNASGENLEEIINSLPSVTPKLSECEDAISRADANKLVDELARAIDDKNRHYPKRGRDIAIIARDIERLPRVIPAIGHGKWIRKGNTLKCPICGAKGTNIKNDYCFNFCPNCGAYMRGAELPHTDKSGLEYADQPALRSAT